MSAIHLPKPGERPDVEVLVDGTWRPGELRMWTQDDDSACEAEVQYRPPGSHSRGIRAFPAEHVCEDYTHPSRGLSDRSCPAAPRAADRHHLSPMD